eukprot:352461-Rhodomonas_salina.1
MAQCHGEIKVKNSTLRTKLYRTDASCIRFRRAKNQSSAGSARVGAWQQQYLGPMAAAEGCLCLVCSSIAPRQYQRGSIRAPR